jgi:hypothetical protein
MTANAPAWLLGRAIYIDGVTRPTTRPCDTDDGDSVAPAGLSPAFRTQPSRNHKVAVALAPDKIFKGDFCACNKPYHGDCSRRDVRGAGPCPVVWWERSQ